MKLNLRELSSFGDQREAILRLTAPALAGVDLMRNRVMIATYVIPEKTAGGIIRIDRQIEESRFQSKVGLIVKMGPAAFKFTDKMDLDNPSILPQVGDWVFYRTADTTECGISIGEDRGNGVSCRLIYDDLVHGRVQNPDSIY